MRKDIGPEPVSWRRVFLRGLFSGTLASLISTAVIARRSVVDNGSPFSGTDATSHWVWGEKAKRRDELSGRHTGLGYLTHHASSVFWGVIFERWFPNRGRSDARSSASNAVAVATLACAADYLVAPKRLTPGFEQPLSRKSMFMVYAGFAVGLAGARYLMNKKFMNKESQKSRRRRPVPFDPGALTESQAGSIYPERERSGAQLSAEDP